MNHSTPAIRTARVAYRTLTWGVLGLSIVLVLLPALAASGLTETHALQARPVLLGAAVLMAGLARAGRSPGGSAATLAPLLILGVLAGDYLLAVAGCNAAAGFHPINAAGLLAVSWGALRTPSA